jgi:hypothetical protein
LPEILRTHPSATFVCDRKYMCPLKSIPSASICAQCNFFCDDAPLSRLRTALQNACTRVPDCEEIIRVNGVSLSSKDSTNRLAL